MSTNKNKMSITIGIPAYNEENNIGKLLQSILSQSQNNFVISKIIVVSDNSEDNTDKIVTSFKNKSIQLIKNKNRMGQSQSQNLIFSIAKTDLVILFEADVIPENKMYLNELIKPIILDNSIGLIQGHYLPLPSITFSGKIFEKQFLVYVETLQKYCELFNKRVSGRGGRVFTKEVYSKLRWPKNVQEDVFALLWCKKNYIRMITNTKAICRYRSPQSFSDFMKENRKIKAGKQSLIKSFGRKRVNSRYFIPISFYVKYLVSFLVLYPVEFILYLVLKIISISNSRIQFTDMLPTTISTKKL